MITEPIMADFNELKNYATHILPSKKEFLDLKQTFESAINSRINETSEIGANLGGNLQQLKLDILQQKQMEL